MKRKIIFIAALPPPITGQALISKMIIDRLGTEFDFTIFNYSRENAVSKSRIKWHYLKKIFQIGKLVQKYAPAADVIYLTISQSLLGNLKDLYFLYKMGSSYQKIIIHLHGGGFDRYYQKAPYLVKRINQLLFKKISQAVVLSDSLKRCLLNLIPEQQIMVIHNCYDRRLLINKDELIKKWKNHSIIEVLFLSNMIQTKGFHELLEGYSLLTHAEQNKIRLHFTGVFESEQQKKIFLNEIVSLQNVFYHGVLELESKKKLLHQTHALFLPTYYPIEGQPLAILEAYAGGLAVFTTNQGGIPDIFEPGKNGDLLEKRSSDSIKKALSALITNFDRYQEIGYFNQTSALNYTEEQFITKIKNVLN